MLTEREKMLAGELYDASDKELAALRMRARRLLYVYNGTAPDEPDKRAAILQDLFGKIKKPVEIEPPFYCDYGSNIHAGERLYMNFGCVVLDCGEVHIGDRALLGPYVQIYAAYHPTDPEIRKTGRELAATVHIGNNVWIGGGAIIGAGVRIGDNTTIGAGSVVVRDVPSNVVAAGNPCKILNRF